jgi:hypothetical protein
MTVSFNKLKEIRGQEELHQGVTQWSEVVVCYGGKYSRIFIMQQHFKN